MSLRINARRQLEKDEKRSRQLYYDTLNIPVPEEGEDVIGGQPEPPPGMALDANGQPVPIAQPTDPNADQNATNEDEWVQAQLNAKTAGLEHPYVGRPWSPDLPKQILLDQMSPEKRYEALYPKAEDAGPLVPIPGADGAPIYGTRSQAVGKPIPQAAAKTGDVNAGSFEDYVLRYAKDRGKTVEQLTLAMSVAIIETTSFIHGPIFLSQTIRNSSTVIWSGKRVSGIIWRAE